MVRLRREMEGLDFEEGRRPPAYWAVEDLQRRVDGPLWERIEAAAEWRGARAMVVGLPAPALRRVLAQVPEQLSVVAPDPELARASLKEIEAAGRTRNATVHARHYADMGFERSSFDVAVLYDCLCRYGSPINVLRKCAREVKMGGVVGLRADMPYAPVEALERFADESRLPRSLRRLLSRLTEREEPAAWGIDWPTVRDGAADLLRFHTEEPVASVAPSVANAVARGGRVISAARAGLLALAERVDAPLRARAPSVIWAVGAKDVGFGKVFPGTRERLDAERGA